MKLRVGDLLPMFAVENAIDGTTFSYRDIWQRRGLLLVSVPRRHPGGEAYVEALRARQPEVRDREAALVVTSDPPAGVPIPGVVVADRWGEVLHLAEGDDDSTWPHADELLDWLTYVQHQCPECQGETR